MILEYRKMFFVGMGLLVSFLPGTVKAETVEPVQVAQEDSFKANEHLWWNHAGRLTENWEGQVFHFGNGYFGVSSDGGVVNETLTLGEKSFWTGGPGDSETNTFGMVPANPADLDSIKYYTSIGDFHNSDRLTARLFNADLSVFGELSSVGELNLEFKKELGEVHDYRRDLNIANSTATVDYTVNGIAFHREYFCSYPDRVFAMKLTSDKSDAINFGVGVNLMHTKRNPQLRIDAANGTIRVDGNIDDNNRPYTILIKVQAEGGNIRAQETGLKVEGSKEATLFYTIATNYKLEAPLYKGADPVRITADAMATAISQGYEATKAKHIADYKTLYDRTSFHLENPVPEREKLPTNERLNFFIKEKDYQDLGLKELAFNFGKYILISSSRPGALPAGLQGCWNNLYHARWFGTYQLDMNVTQTYMFGNALNLPECQLSFIDYLLDKIEVGKQAVKHYYGLDNSWSTFMIGNVWGHVGILGGLNLKYISTAWVAIILWEQYLFEKDENFLRKIYPLLKQAAYFYKHNLVEYKNTGKLVYAGTTSAEHVPTLGATTPGFQDIAFAEETFANFIEASKILHVDKSSRKEMEHLKSKLMPYKVGRWGQFQEWIEDIDDKNCQHRHMSQLMCLLPCRLLNPYESPELAEAAKVTLNHRGDADFTALYGIGCNSPKYPSTCLHEWLPYDFYTSQVWCRAARMCNWIRLLDGDRADKIYNDIFRESTLPNMIQYETKANYDDEPTSTPFFLDGTVLSAGYVTEMVLQSHLGTLDILPALPSAWKSGCLKGVKARGGLIMDVEWKNSQLVKAVITSSVTKMCQVRYKGQLKTIKVVNNEPYVFTPNNTNNQ